ncbi:MAG: isochorismatase family cysteine hydrolase [Chloroflexota bacterium]
MNPCLIVVDVQNGFITNRETRQVEARIKTLLAANLFETVIFTQFINAPNSPYRTLMNWHGLSTPETQALAESLQPFAEIVFQKDGYSSITQTVLDYLKAQQIDVAFVLGIDTDCCVLQTAVDLFAQTIHPYVLAHYSASGGGIESHNAGLKVLERLIGRQNIIQEELTGERLQQLL